MSAIKVFQSKEQLESAFSDKTIRVIRIGDRKVCLAKHGQSFFCFEHLCPHQMHPLSEGQITAFGEIVCPLHEYRYNLKTGTEASQRCRDLKTFKVDINDEGVFINLY